MSIRVRPSLRFDTIDDVIADIRVLQRAGYEQHGNWTLPQICWHVGKVIEPTLKSPTNRSATPEQNARWHGFIEVIRQPGGGSKFPAGANEPTDPCSDADVEHLIDLFQQLKNFPDTHVDTTVLGAQPLESVQEAHRLHAAHHLSFLQPAAERRSDLQFKDFDAAIADVEALRKGCVQVGNWTLPQIAWHLNKTTQGRLQPPPFAPDTDEMRGRASVLRQVLASGKIPRIVAPPQLMPPESAGDSDIEQLLQSLRRAKTHSGFSPHRLFGTMSDDDSRRHILIHSAHHLSFLVPATPRDLKFGNIDALIGEVEHLQRGYRRTGNWSLEQIAWHCGQDLRVVKPVPVGTVSTPAQQAAKRERFDQFLAAGQIPPGRPIPPGLDPIADAPANVHQDAVQAYLDGLRMLAVATQPQFLMERFGLVSADEFKRFVILHSTHHLNRLIPTT